MSKTVSFVLKSICLILSLCNRASYVRYEYFSSRYVYFLLTLNLRTLKRLSLVKALSDIVLTLSVHEHILEKVRPRCLWFVVSSIMVLFLTK